MKLLTIKLAIIFSILLTGCATGAKVENISVLRSAQESYQPLLMDKISVDEVSGGKSTNPLWTSEISNKSFQEALSITLKERGLLADNGAYALTADLIEVEQPLLSFNTTVTTEIKYTLTNRSTNQILLEKTISASFKAKVSDAIFAAKRLRLATEGSAKENIKLFLVELAKLDANSISIS